MPVMQHFNNEDTFWQTLSPTLSRATATVLQAHKESVKELSQLKKDETAKIIRALRHCEELSLPYPKPLLKIDMSDFTQAICESPCLKRIKVMPCPPHYIEEHWDF